MPDSDTGIRTAKPDPNKLPPIAPLGGGQDDAIASLLLTPAEAGLGVLEMITQVCERLLDAGVPVFRVACAMPAMHPQSAAYTLAWQRDKGAWEEAFEHGDRDSESYRSSPVALIRQGAAGIRRRLDIAEPLMDFPILHELKASGVTDYVILPLRLGATVVSYVSWATDRPGGFSTAHLSRLEGLLPLAALRLRLAAANRMTRDLLTTYLGRAACEQVLQGTIRRGQGERINAAIMLCDLRGFTAMTDAMDPARLIAMLNDYHECMTRSVLEHGGEVLKFMGDGMLAIFRVGSGSTEGCNRAMQAAVAALGRLDKLNETRAAAGQPPLKAGIGLHLGEVMYGNIGASDRLDFTVIGRAVNEVARIEAMCRPLDRVLIASDAFSCSCIQRPLVSLGRHALRGVKEPRELFGLA